MEKLMCKYKEYSVPREMCTFSSDNTETDESCVGCDEICAENDGYSCDECPIQKAFDKLAAFEALGVTPEQIKEMDRLYAEKCKEVAELQKIIKTQQDFEMSKVVVLNNGEEKT